MKTCRMLYCTNEVMSDGDCCRSCFESMPAAHKGYEFLRPAFLLAMNDIGRYGNEKYGADSFVQRANVGDRSRGNLKRTTSQAIADHCTEHFNQYLSHVAHDYFGTDKHQLAAVAFNAMMEFYFAGLEELDIK